jgi:hypothetical protein
MTRFTFIAALFLSLAACTGCGDDASNKDGSATAQDAGYDGDTQD